MANVEQLVHLEHLEDEMLNRGVEGCKKTVGDLKEVREKLGCQGNSFMQTKWDGSPSIVCGWDPYIEGFFVGTKSVFNKGEKKRCFSLKTIREYYGNSELATKLMYAFRYFKGLGIEGVIQGDFLFIKGELKTKLIHGEQLYTFKPNTVGNGITYGIPVNSDIGKRAIQAEVGVVFHTKYSGPTLDTMRLVVGSGVNISKLRKTSRVWVVDNDTPMPPIGFLPNEEREFDNTVSMIESYCASCGDFLDWLVLKGSGTGNPTGEAKYHIAPYIKQYFADEIKPDGIGPNGKPYRKGGAITKDIDVTVNQLIQFYGIKMNEIISKLKSPKTIAEKVGLTKITYKEIDKNRDKFKSMIHLYKLIQDLKYQIIMKLAPLEKDFRMFVRDAKGDYVVTKHEGMVLHRDGDLTKFVDRIEFSRNNAIKGK